MGEHCAAEWSEGNTFLGCELDAGHESPHRAVLEWSDAEEGADGE